MDIQGWIVFVFFAFIGLGFIFYSFASYSDDFNYNAEPGFKLRMNGMEIGRRNGVK